VRKLLLLLLFFFSLSGFATTTEQQLYEQKYQLEQQKEQIKGLEDGLKKYTDDKVEDSNKRVDIINGSVDRFTGVVAILGIGLPIILFLIGWFSAKNTAKKETEEFLNEWVKIKADGDFKELAEKKLDAKLQEFEIKANDQLKEFETKYEAELNAIRQQVRITDEKQDVEILFNKAYRLGQEGKREEARVVYDQLIAQFKHSKHVGIQEHVSMAMYNNGILCAQLGKSEEAIAVYDALIRQFKNVEFNGFQDRVAKATINKYEFLIIKNREFSKEEEKWIKSINLKPENKAFYGLLRIIDKARESLQDNEIARWQEEYKEIKDPDWSFEDLKAWITNSSHKEEVKNRISGYIDTFEKHLHRD
jgi:hypothetical protein